jgi:peptidyl-prolyl cis-trans isomerase A (cyclophilin A)
MITILAALLLQAAAPEPATAPLPAPATADPALAAIKLVRVALTTSAGVITLALDETHAPITTANFLRYVDAKRLDGMSFYRTMKLSDGLGLIQGGVRDPRKLFPPIAHEPTNKTGLSHDDGAISMARNAPGSATADFFIILRGMHALDAHPEEPGDNLGFAVFGHVVEGMDVVKAIHNGATSPTLGEGAMKGQMLEPKIQIISARRVK